MLPDYPEIKKDVGEFVMHFMQMRIAYHSGFVGQIKRTVIPEGDHNRLIRSDGTVDDTRPEKVAGNETIPVDPKIGLSFDDALQKLDSIAKQIAQQQSKVVFERLREVTDKTGNVVNVKMEEFSLKTLNDMLERMPIEFDDKGNPRLPSIVCGPEMWKKVMDRRAEIESDQLEKRRMDEIMATKREDFRVRESRRRLVS